MPVDITERSQAEAAVKAVDDRFGRRDILVNNARLMLLWPIVDLLKGRPQTFEFSTLRKRRLAALKG